MIAAIIQARLGSSRLPDKVLREINGRPLLSYMLERATAAKRIGQVVVATTDQPRDNRVVEFCQKEAVPVFCGNEDDVLDRYYQCASQFKIDTVVRLTADCPLIDPRVIDEIVEVYSSGGYDFVANTVPPIGTYPDGMDVEVFSFGALERAWKESIKPSEREHVTFFIWNNPHLFKTHRHDLSHNVANYRLTVDYPADFEVIQSIFLSLYSKNNIFSMQEIIAYLDQNPEIRTLNTPINWNQGWQTAFTKDKNAGF